MTVEIHLEMPDTVPDGEIYEDYVMTTHSFTFIERLVLVFRPKVRVYLHNILGRSFSKLK